MADSSRGGGCGCRSSSRALATVAGIACFGGSLLHLLVSAVGCQSRCVSRLAACEVEVNIGGRHVTVSEVHICT